MSSTASVSAASENDEDLEASRRRATASGRPVRVLAVDDHEINRRVLQSICELLDFECELVCDGDEALKAMQTGAYDLVLMDICMPGMDGVQTTCAIKDLGGDAASTPIIAVTANPEGDAGDGPQRYFAAGMCAIVQKPVRIEQLARAIYQALSDRPPQGVTLGRALDG